jgi:hypothetical protein
MRGGPATHDKNAIIAAGLLKPEPDTVHLISANRRKQLVQLAVLQIGPLMNKERLTLFPGYIRKVGQAQHIGIIKSDAVAYCLQKPTAGKLVQFVPKEKIVGCLAGQALARRRGMKKAVTPQKSQSV